MKRSVIPAGSDCQSDASLGEHQRAGKYRLIEVVARAGPLGRMLEIAAHLHSTDFQRRGARVLPARGVLSAYRNYRALT